MSDRNVESVINVLIERAEVGKRKYGVTTERDDLDFESWLQHLQEELLDGAVYIARLRTEQVPEALQRAEAAEAELQALEIRFNAVQEQRDAMYVAYPKLEARCKRLKEALQLAIREMEIAKDHLQPDYRTEEPGCFDDSLHFCREALSDTAQQETTGAEYNVAEGKAYDEGEADGKLLGSKDMRERAAKLIRAMESDGFDPRRFVDQIADAVETLPIDPETGGE